MGRRLSQCQRNLKDRVKQMDAISVSRGQKQGGVCDLMDLLKKSQTDCGRMVRALWPSTICDEEKTGGLLQGEEQGLRTKPLEES